MIKHFHLVQDKFLKDFERFSEVFRSQEEPRRYLGLNNAYKFYFEIVRYKKSYFKQEFKNLLIDRIQNQISSIQSSDLELICNAVGIEIIKRFNLEILKDKHLLSVLIETNPSLIKEYFQEIIQRKYYSHGYVLIDLVPELIPQFSKEIKLILDNIKLFKSHYSNAIERIFSEYDEIRDYLIKKREREKYEFLKRINNILEDLENFEIESTWLQDNSHFLTENVDMYNNKELELIIKTIIALKIQYKSKKPKTYWTGRCFISISHANKKELFKGYINELLDLGYFQVVKEFLEDFPHLIQNYKENLLENLESHMIFEIFTKFNKEFRLEHPENIFIDMFRQEYSFDLLYFSFYENYPSRIPLFNKLLEDYFNKASYNSDYDISNYIRKIFGTRNSIKLNYSIDFLNQKLDEYMNNEKAIEFFRPRDSIYLIHNFNNIREDLKINLVRTIFKHQWFEEYGSLLNLEFSSSKEYFDEFLKCIPPDEYNLFVFYEILKIMIRNEQGNGLLHKKIFNKMKELSSHISKAQILSFLGFHQNSSEEYINLIKNEYKLPNSIVLYIDYKLEYIESSIELLKHNDITNAIDELGEIKTRFFEYNKNDERISIFNFKYQNYKARLLFAKGIFLLQDWKFNNAKEIFIKSSIIYKNLMESFITTDESKLIFSIYKEINNIFQNKIILIESSIKNGNPSLKDINKRLKSEFKRMLSILPPNSLKLSRIKNPIEQILITSKNVLKQIKLEPPTLFCRNEPLLNGKVLKKVDYELDSNGNVTEKYDKILEWDSQNRMLTSESLELTTTSMDYLLELQFLKENESYNYDIEIKTSEDIKIYEKCTKKSKGKFKYYFEISSPLFNGAKKIEIHLNLDDACARKRVLKLLTHHEEDDKFRKNLKFISRFIDTGFTESTNYLKNQMLEYFEKIEIYTKKNLENFCKIISYLVNLMELSDDDGYYLQKEAENFWNEHKNDSPINMETRWFQKKLNSLLINKFKSQNVIWDPKITRGKVDFLVFNLPVEAKFLKTRVRSPYQEFLSFQ